MFFVGLFKWVGKFCFFWNLFKVINFLSYLGDKWEY